jgi:hypothetical protein
VLSLSWPKVGGSTSLPSFCGWRGVEIFIAWHTHAISAVAASAEIPPSPASSESSVRSSVGCPLNAAGNWMHSGCACRHLSARVRTPARSGVHLVSLYFLLLLMPSLPDLHPLGQAGAAVRPGVGAYRRLLRSALRLARGWRCFQRRTVRISPSHFEGGFASRVPLCCMPVPGTHQILRVNLQRRDKRSSCD